ncbi:hypothetical protein LCGC14_1778620, partial [marine sediment metagenome]
VEVFAIIEVYIAILIVFYVGIRYLYFYIGTTKSEGLT